MRRINQAKAKQLMKMLNRPKPQSPKEQMQNNAIKQYIVQLFKRSGV